ncbi:MAG: hypothetical protein JNM12_13220 [Alphaproteobacteria bacterium]|nr:hypothetical protein [Alphaproteobacteria bacterium]
MDPVTLLLPLLVIACGITVLRRRRKRKSVFEVNTDILPVVKMPATPHGDALDQHRDAILGHLWTVIAGLEKQRQSDPPNAEGWAMLTGAVLKYATAVQLRPRSIPVIIIATTNAASILERESENELPDPLKAANIHEMSYFLHRSCAPHKDALLKSHGHTLTPAETKQALEFINSLQWDREQKAFAQKTLH